MRRTWLVGDGPCKFLADRDRRFQRHHLMLYGTDAPTDNPSAQRKHRCHADLSCRDLASPIKEKNSDICGGTQNMYLASCGIKMNKETCAKITDEDCDLKAMLERKNLPGKIGSAHWRAIGPVPEKGSWNVNIFSPDDWEGFMINPIEKEKKNFTTPPPRERTGSGQRMSADFSTPSPVRLSALADFGR